MKLTYTAEMYHNEKMIGEVISGIRDKLFLVSKVLPSNAGIHGTIQACERSLKKLKTDYLDLYLVHLRVFHQPRTTERNKGLYGYTKYGTEQFS